MVDGVVGPMTAREQSEFDRAEIKIKVISNGVLVKCGIEWFTFPTWEEAQVHVGKRIEAVKRKMQQHKPS